MDPLCLEIKGSLLIGKHLGHAHLKRSRQQFCLKPCPGNMSTTAQIQAAPVFPVHVNILMVTSLLLPFIMKHSRKIKVKKPQDDAQFIT